MENYNGNNMQTTTSVTNASEKDCLVTFLLCFFCGGIGVHRYYVGKIGTGILYTLTLGLFGIGYLFDLIILGLLRLLLLALFCPLLEAIRP